MTHYRRAITYQLPVNYLQYTPILNQRLTNDLTLFEKTLHVHITMTRYPSTVRKTLLVILDQVIPHQAR